MGYEINSNGETKMIKTIVNKFHATKCNIRVPANFSSADEYVQELKMAICAGRATPSERALVRRVDKALCGQAGCRCGNGI